MKSILLGFISIFFIHALSAQNIYSEKFKNCELSTFCLDCGDIKAEPPATILAEIIENLNKSVFNKTSGTIEAQILVDDTGRPCLLSVENLTNSSVVKLKLQKAINSTSDWKAAVTDGLNKNSSVSLIFNFNNGQLSIGRRVFDFKNATNQRSVGESKVKGTRENKLTKSWTVYNQSNSALPWDMTRSVVTDLDNNIWIGTDNGIVKVTGEQWKLYTTQNTIIEPSKYNVNKTQGVRYAEVDKKNNKWFVLDWDVYKYDNVNWKKYDSINSPINWARKIIVDQKNNIWFTSWKGIAKFDGEKFTVFNKENSNLPTDKVLGAYVDKKDRIWIGTFEGNVVIENNITKFIDDKRSPLSSAFILKGFEDKKGNIWFSLYNREDYKSQGIYILNEADQWTRINFPRSNEILNDTSINDFLLDEERQELWVTLGGIGVLCYSLEKKEWEIYTNQNSNIPSTQGEQITQDKDGNIWIATYAGVVKLNRK